MRRDRVREITELAGVRRDVDVDALGVVVKRRVRRSDTGRQAAVHGRVEDLGALREEQLANVVHC